MPVMINQKAGRFVTLDTSSNVYFLSTANVDATEAVTGLTINSLKWSSNGNITIARGANTILVLHGSGFWDCQEGEPIIRDRTAANVVVTFSASSTGSLVMEMSKDVTFNTTY